DRRHPFPRRPHPRSRPSRPQPGPGCDSRRVARRAPRAQPRARIRMLPPWRVRRRTFIMSSATLVSPVGPLGATGSTPASAAPSYREEILRAYEQRVFAKTNQMFSWLLLIQWVFALGVALIWS